MGVEPSFTACSGFSRAEMYSDTHSPLILFIIEIYNTIHEDGRAFFSMTETLHFHVSFYNNLHR